jgi:hypothetical protein
MQGTHGASYSEIRQALLQLNIAMQPFVQFVVVLDYRLDVLWVQRSHFTKRFRLRV